MINSQVYVVQNMLLICLGIILICGACIALLLSINNYKPIVNLRNQMSPVNVVRCDYTGIIDDYDMIGAEIQKIQLSIRLQKQKKQNELVLMQILGNHFQTRTLIIDNLEHIGISAEEKYFAIMFVKFAHYTENFDNWIDGLLPDGCQYSYVSYVEGSEYICLVTLTQNQINDEIIKKLQTSIKSDVWIIMSRTSRDVLDIPLYYHQVVSQFGKLDGAGSHFIQADALSWSDNKLYYPYLVIESLRSAITVWDTEKAELLLNELLELITSNREQAFFAVSVGLDTINTVLHAAEALEHSRQTEISAIVEDAQVDCSVDKLICVLYRLEEYISSNIGNEKMNVIDQVIEYINRNIRDPEMNTSSVANYFGMSLSNLSHQFNRQTGIRISDYINQLQIDYAKQLLESTDLTINQIAELFGFTQPSSFVRKFKRIAGMTPNEYRQVKKNLSADIGE